MKAERRVIRCWQYSVENPRIMQVGKFLDLSMKQSNQNCITKYFEVGILSFHLLMRSREFFSCWHQFIWWLVLNGTVAGGDLQHRRRAGEFR